MTSPVVGDVDGFGRYGLIDRDEQSVGCHECGRRFRMLVQHLRQAHGLTVADYRARHGLPATVPLTSIATSARIGELSKARVGGPAWHRFEERRDCTIVRSQRAATAASARPAPGTTAARRDTARARFAGQDHMLDEQTWMTHLLGVVQHRARTGRWPSKASRDREVAALGRWLDHQRRDRREGRMLPQRAAALRQAGVSTRALVRGSGAYREPPFWGMVDQVRADPRLATPAAHIARAAHLRGRLGPLRTAALEAAGFEWTPPAAPWSASSQLTGARDQAWARRWADLQEARDRLGHWPMARRNVDAAQTRDARWLSDQLTLWRKDALQAWRAEELAKAGFSTTASRWNARPLDDERWFERLAQVRRWMDARDGRPPTMGTMRLLARWVTNSRQQARTGRMPAHRVEAFKKAGLLAPERVS